MAPEIFDGKFGGVLQVDYDDARLMPSQVSLLIPLQKISLEKPFNNKKNLRKGCVRLC
jgi:hypothetical protein